MNDFATPSIRTDILSDLKIWTAYYTYFFYFYHWGGCWYGSLICYWYMDLIQVDRSEFQARINERKFGYKARHVLKPETTTKRNHRNWSERNHRIETADRNGRKETKSPIGFCTLCFCFPTKMLHLNDPFCPLKCSVFPKKSLKCSNNAHYTNDFFNMVLTVNTYINIEVLQVTTTTYTSS